MVFSSDCSHDVFSVGLEWRGEVQVSEDVSNGVDTNAMQNGAI